MRPLDSQDVCAIYKVIAEFAKELGEPIHPFGIRDKNLLESAVSRQHTGFGGIQKYSDIRQIAASLLFGICNDHPFHNGNKRTALVCTLSFLAENGYTPQGTRHKDFEDLVLATSSHNLSSFAKNHGLEKKHSQVRDIIKRTGANCKSMDDEVDIVFHWLARHTRHEELKERPIPFRRLRQILTKFDCEFAKSPDSKISIRREVTSTQRLLGIFKRTEQLKTHLTYYGENHTMDVGSLKKIRSDLHLSAKHGCDSRDFYDNQAVVDSLLVEYKNILQRLAKK